MSGKGRSSKTVKGPLNTTYLHTRTQSGLMVTILKHIPSTSKPLLLFTTKTSGLSTDSVLCNTPEDRWEAVFQCLYCYISPLLPLFCIISILKQSEVTKATTICSMKENQKAREHPVEL